MSYTSPDKSSRHLTKAEAHHKIPSTAKPDASHRKIHGIDQRGGVATEGAVLPRLERGNGDSEACHTETTEKGREEEGESETADLLNSRNDNWQMRERKGSTSPN